MIGLTLFWGAAVNACGQTSEVQVLQPILLDKMSLSGIGLKQINLKNEPERAFFQKNLYRGEELSVYIVSSQSWPGKMDNFSIDEYVYIFNGKSRARPQDGKDIFFQTGEHFVIPKGFTGDWEVMAADNYHYELSVITTQRAPLSEKSSTQFPHLFDKDKLSGLSITLDENGTYHDQLYLGDELHIFLHAENPQTKTLSTPAQEQLLHLLAGQLSLTDTQGKVHTFFTGDFVIIPKGFTGKWESQGHGLMKCIGVEKANLKAE